MRLRLVRRCEFWCPTWFGSLLIVLLVGIPLLWCCCYAESYLSLTERVQPEVLVVEGWIGIDGVRAAEAEFRRHSYQYIVATSDLHADPWDKDHSSFADMSARELIRLGIPKDKIIVASAEETESQRTFQAATAVWTALQERGIKPRNLTVFTLGSHARRSRLIFAKVEGTETKVGVISWAPPGYETMPWWRSSERAKAMLTETAGYLFEVLLNSGRTSNSPGSGTQRALEGRSSERSITQRALGKRGG